MFDNTRSLPHSVLWPFLSRLTYLPTVYSDWWSNWIKLQSGKGKREEILKVLPQTESHDIHRYPHQCEPWTCWQHMYSTSRYSMSATYMYKHMHSWMIGNNAGRETHTWSPQEKEDRWFQQHTWKSSRREGTDSTQTHAITVECIRLSVGNKLPMNFPKRGKKRKSGWYNFILVSQPDIRTGCGKACGQQ